MTEDEQIANAVAAALAGEIQCSECKDYFCEEELTFVYSDFDDLKRSYPLNLCHECFGLMPPGREGRNLKTGKYVWSDE